MSDDGETYEIVWSGGEGLVPDRESRPSGFWTPPKRLYTGPAVVKDRKTFTADDVARMMQLHSEGKTFADIGRVFDVYGNVISRIILRNSVDKPSETLENSSFPNEDNDE